MRRRLEIDAGFLLSALTRPFEIGAYLDLESGEVLLEPPFDDEDDEAAGAEHADAVEIPRLDSGEEYRLMARFADSVTEDDVRDRLALALDGRGAFGRFRHVLRGYPDLEAEWQQLRDEWLRTEARAWLESLEIDAILGHDPPEPEPAPARDTGRRELPIGLLDLLLLGAPEGKTELLEGKVYRVFIAASPSEARAVFKRVARDLCEFHGTAWRNRFIEGRDSYAIDRARLDIDQTRVELSLEVSPQLWRRFGG